MTRKLRILIVAYCFPPMNTIASHRPYGWARAWRDLGHDVHVLTPVKRAYDGSMDLECDLAGIAVHEAEYLGSGRNTAGAKASAAASARWERLKSATRRARFSLAMFGDARLLAWRGLRRAGEGVLASSRFDLIVATSPPEVSFLAARQLSARSGVPWVADFRDLWFSEMRLYQSRAASWLAGLAHRWLLRSACALLTVSVGQKQRLAGFLGREVLNSYNGFFSRERLAVPRAQHWADDRIHIVYTGRVYPGKQDPEPLFSALGALRRAGGPAGKIAVDFYGHENPWLRDLVARHRLEDSVRLHGLVTHQESLAAQRAADALLFLDWADARGEGVLAGKLFEYIGSARPILSIGRREPAEAAALLAHTGCGVTLSTAEEISAYLDELAASAPLPDVDSPARLEFSREAQARALLDELQARLPPAAPPPARDPG